MKKQKTVIVLLVLVLILMLSACGDGKGTAAPKPTRTGTTAVTENNQAENVNQNNKFQVKEDGQKVSGIMLKMKIGETAVAVKWENNETVRALQGLCVNKPLTIQMSMYGGFEQVGEIGKSLPRDDRQMTAVSGDVVLYSGNRIVIFYGSNSWSYTKLGRITDKNAAEMAKLLGNGDAIITLSMHNN